MARQADLAELAEFKKTFAARVNQAAELKANTDSDVLLKLKEDLDKLYEQSAGLAGNTGNYKEGILKLTKTIMRAVRTGAGDDATAQAELSQEETARTRHYELLEIPLVSHLLRPDSPIQPNQLVAVLLGENTEQINQILSLFEHVHMVDMRRQAEILLQDYPDGVAGAPHAGGIFDLLCKYADGRIRH